MRRFYCQPVSLSIWTKSVGFCLAMVVVLLPGIFAALPLHAQSVSFQGLITTVAGHGSGCSGQTDAFGDGCAAVNSTMAPSAVAFDGAGNMYIADIYQRIRKIDAVTGIITTVAGGGGGCPGQTDSVGDGCPAASGTLNYPWGIAVDTAGNIYIADTNNQRVRKVDVSTQIITTVAGNGYISYPGPPSSGGYNGDNIPATSAELNAPWGIAVDSAGNLYIGDTGNHRVRKVTAATASSPPRQGSEPRVTTVTPSRPPAPNCYRPWALPWIASATCTSVIRATIASARLMRRRASLPPCRGTEALATTATTSQPPAPS